MKREICIVTNKKVAVENLILVFAVMAAAFLFLLKSPLHPWIGGYTATDSSVFKTVALMIENGYMPYKDSFDHKGPLIYIINLIGNKISAHNGICLLEFLFLSAFFLFEYKTARFFCKPPVCIIVVFLTIIPLFSFFEGGNLTEEYSMCFISISQYIFLDYIINHKISWPRIVIFGMCFGCVFLLKQNLVSLWIVVFIFIIFDFARKKDWHSLLYFLSFFFLGAICICVPFTIWLFRGDAFNPFINDYFLFNGAYVSQKNTLDSLKLNLDTFIYFLRNPIVLIAFLLQMFNFSKEKKRIDIIFFIYMVISLVLISMSGVIYGHYGMALIPMLVYPYAIFFMTLKQMQEIQEKPQWVGVTTIVICIILFMSNCAGQISKYPEIIKDRNKENIPESVLSITDYLAYNTEPDDKISVYGNYDLIYVLSNRLHATNYSYQFPISQAVPEIMEDYLAQLKNERPKVIVIQPGVYDKTIASFLKDNGYEAVFDKSLYKIKEDR